MNIDTLLTTYNGMKTRCYNKHHLHYPNYGGRGIKVCDKWLGKDGLKHFLEDMGERPEGCTLDRIDNDKNYCPENCRWANRSEQMNNTRRSVRISYNGEQHTVTEWAEKLGVNRSTIYMRIKRSKMETPDVLAQCDHRDTPKRFRQY